MSGLREVLAAHDGMSFDLGTPREFTQHGGWNAACSCGEHLCSHPGGECDCLLEHTAAAVLDWLRARLASDEVRWQVATSINHADNEAIRKTNFEYLSATYDEQADAALTAVLAALGRDDEGRSGAQEEGK